MKKSVDHLGNKIKRLRSFRDMTQEDIAKRLGKTRSLVSFFERTGNVNKYTFQEIAEILNTTVEDLEAGIITVDFQMDEHQKNKTSGRANNQQLIDQSQAEIVFPKETINHQWELLQGKVMLNFCQLSHFFQRTTFLSHFKVRLSIFLHLDKTMQQTVY